MELLYDSAFEGSGILCEEESRHAISVMRHKKGDVITITDGRGNLFESAIVDSNPKKCLLELVKATTLPQSLPRLHLAVAPTKNIDRFEWFLEKATEIGINEITPLICDHSERDRIRIDRMEKIVIAAMKQSLKFHLPKINEPVEASRFIASATDAHRFILHCRKGNMPHLFDMLTPSADSTILVGPEGDFSVKEIEFALANGYSESGLGSNRLRTETAAMVACHTFSLKNR